MTARGPRAPRLELAGEPMTRAAGPDIRARKRTPPPSQASGSSSDLAGVMELQRLAGNAAVCQLLRAGSVSPSRADAPEHLEALAAARPPGTWLAQAGTPRPSAAPDGRTFLYTLSYGSAGWTGVPNAAAYTNPDFQTDWQREQTDAGQTRHFAVVRPTSSPDVTIDSWFLGAGDHVWDGVTQVLGGVTYRYFTRVSQAMSDLVRDGEQEHVNDVQRAYDICYGLIANRINALAGRRFGPAPTPAAADQLALDALEATLPVALSTRQPGFRGAWVRIMDALLAQTQSRDRQGWHTMTETGQRRDRPRRRVVLDLAPSSTTSINSVPSDRVVNYPTNP